MDKERLKEGLRKEVLEMVERVWAKMPDSLRAFREVERAVVEATGELRATVQSVARSAPEHHTPPVFSRISQSVSVRADSWQQTPPPKYDPDLFVLTTQFLNVRLEDSSA